ncbi:hypothetical protein FRB99_006662 [Tulasnella sp. 403]|nr:hypothetical protein FRB99_006662 [Tulasnella sp. 403]
MSLADMGVRDLTVCGPSGLSHYIASARLHLRRTQLGVKILESPSLSDESLTPILNDENLTIYAIPLSVNETRQDSPSSTGSSKRKRSKSPPTHAKRRSGDLRSEGTQQQLLSMPDMDSFRFLPSSLTGSNASSWRQRIVDWMFRPLNQPPKPTLTLEENEVDAQALSSQISDPGKQHYTKRLPSFTGESPALSYIVIGPETRGKFDVRKADELGVPKPMRSRLTKGQSIVTPDGVTVTPDMVLSQATPPSAFMFVHCPSVAYIDDLVSSDALHPQKYNPSAELRLIIHRVGEGVLEDSRYQEWMRQYPGIRHLVAAEPLSSNPLVFTGSANVQLRLSQLDPEVFRVPRYSNQAPRLQPDFPDLDVRPLESDVDIRMQPFPDPASGTDPFSAPILPENTYAQTISEMDSPDYINPLAEEYAKAQESVRVNTPQSPSASAQSHGSDVVITTLGTGSAMPSKYRNVSSNLVQIPKWGTVLLDCGEGTWGQVCRHFGIEHANSADPSLSPTNLLLTSGNTENNSTGNDSTWAHATAVLRDLKCVFISHAHADHHLGLAKILARRRALQPAVSEPLYLIASRYSIQHLYEYNELEDMGINDPRYVRVIDAFHIDWQADKADPRIQQSAGYSGDTMPCTNLVDAGWGATVLIHEATMADDQADLALAKAHSTCGQAIEVGRRMEAKNILLTHFSQRYPKMPELDKGESVLNEAFERQNTAENSDDSPPADARHRAPVAIAFDHASFKIGSLWKIEKYMNAIAKTFVEQEGSEPGNGEADDTVAGLATEPPSSPVKKEKRNEMKGKEKQKAAVAAVGNAPDGSNVKESSTI